MRIWARRLRQRRKPTKRMACNASPIVPCGATCNTWPPTNIAAWASKSANRSQERTKAVQMTATLDCNRMGHQMKALQQPNGCIGRMTRVTAPSSIDSINGFMMRPQRASRHLRVVAWTSKGTGIWSPWKSRGWISILMIQKTQTILKVSESQRKPKTWWKTLNGAPSRARKAEDDCLSDHRRGPMRATSPGSLHHA